MRVSFAPIAIAALAVSSLSGCSLLGGATVEELQVSVGECISDPAVADEGDQEVGELPVVDCAEPHFGEVYHTENVADEEFSSDIVTQADEVCYQEFEGFIGLTYEESQYYISAMSPTSASWDLGDRQIACLVVGGTGEEITGSLEGAAA
ncbi:septum formation family protein [Demequina muriae]|uniref:Septum formation family protein n=1 Tax=Demequina muriae TaxID=3051664 RepID=A0ABT8GG09_9MICO|nr:septum formation family protein [Demequina sp. EGI L300058]MDN4480374.1 septum formation family protein [Demequina sp. EGI L300058]